MNSRRTLRVLAAAMSLVLLAGCVAPYGCRPRGMWFPLAAAFAIGAAAGSSCGPSSCR